MGIRMYLLKMLRRIGIRFEMETYLQRSSENGESREFVRRSRNFPRKLESNLYKVGESRTINNLLEVVQSLLRLNLFDVNADIQQCKTEIPERYDGH